MYGNTHQVAEAIGAGLRPAFDVSVMAVAKVTLAVLAGADLVVGGGPTHAHGMSRAGTRKWAVSAANRGRPAGRATGAPGWPLASRRADHTRRHGGLSRRRTRRGQIVSRTMPISRSSTVPPLSRSPSCSYSLVTQRRIPRMRAAVSTENCCGTYMSS